MTCLHFLYISFWVLNIVPGRGGSRQSILTTRAPTASVPGFFGPFRALICPRTRRTSKQSQEMGWRDSVANSQFTQGAAGLAEKCLLIVPYWSVLCTSTERHYCWTTVVWRRT